MNDKSFHSNLTKLQTLLYEPRGYKLKNIFFESEGKGYQACTYELNERKVISRQAKITPKKIGQFVTVWKRNESGITAPYHENDEFDFIVVNASSALHFGQFIFPKSKLIEKGVVSSALKEGKRGIRVYPPWDVPTSKQAQKTQEWQLNYFLDIGDGLKLDFNRAKLLYSSF